MFTRMCILLFIFKNVFNSPLIRIQPKTQTVLDESIVNFYCETLNIDSIEWRKNGKTFNNARTSIRNDTHGNSVLRINPVSKTDDEGNYECSSGDHVSSVAKLVVLDDAPVGFPQIVQYFARSRYTYTGNNGYIECPIEGDRKPNIIWLRHVTRINSNDSRYSISKNKWNSLQIRNVQLSDQDVYECVAENEFGTVYSGYIRFGVMIPTKPPEIVVRPQLMYKVIRGSDVNISCEATGEPTPVTKWYHEVTVISVEDKSQPERGVLLLENVQNSGFYTCYSENERGSRDVSTEIIVISNVDSIILWPHNQTVISEQIASFFCDVTTSINHASTIKWRKGGKPITKEEGIMIIDAPNGSVLRLTAVNIEQDPGKYQCYYGNYVSNVATLAVLNESVAGEIAGFPRAYDQYVPDYAEVDKDIRLVCGGVGYPSPTITWLKDMVPLNMSDDRYSFSQREEQHNCILTIKSVRTDDEGQYEYLLQNFLGVASKTSYLRVYDTREPPKFQIAPEILYEIAPGSDLNITCKASGYPVPVVKWWSEITDPALEEQMQPRNENSVLQLRNVQKSANYSCIATSKMGNISIVTSVVVNEGLLPPTQLELYQISSDSIRLMWKHDKGVDIDVYYCIHYKPTLSTDEYSLMCEIPTTHVIIDDLELQDYEFYVTANKSGKFHSKSSDTVNIILMEIDPHTASKIVATQLLSTTAVVIRWKKPKKSPELVKGYNVYFTSDSQQSLKNWNIESVANQQLFTIHNLEPRTTYAFRVQALMTAQLGVPSRPVRMKTQFRVPNHPRNFQVEVLGTDLKLTWEKPIDNGEPIVSYELGWADWTTYDHAAFTATPNSKKYTIRGLYPETKYHVWMTANSLRGRGTTTAPVLVKIGKLDLEPQNVRVTIVDITAIRVQWTAMPDWKKLGIITGYHIHFEGFTPGTNGTRKSDYDIPDVNTEEFVIGDLLPDTNCDIEISFTARQSNGPAVRKFLRMPSVGSPTNVDYTIVIPNVIVISWKPPTINTRNTDIDYYEIQLYKQTDVEKVNTTIKTTKEFRVTFSELDEDTVYVVQVRARIYFEYGVYSNPVEIRTPGDRVQPPQWVRSTATSTSSCFVWWEAVGDIPYRLYYTNVKNYEKGNWLYKDVGTTDAVELVNLKPYNEYYIYVAARTDYYGSKGRLSPKSTVRIIPEDVPTKLSAHNVTTTSAIFTWNKPTRLKPTKYQIVFNGYKEYFDSQSVLQKQEIPANEIYLDSDALSYTMTSLLPFTNYRVNLTAIPPDNKFQPSVRITVTTEMAAPLPMIKPDVIGIEDDVVQIALPQASEEYGPIIYYYLVVVLNNEDLQYNSEDSLRNVDTCANCSYVAAKFFGKSIPFTFSFGDGLKYNGFYNKFLEKSVRYRCFVKAVVFTTDDVEELSTSSPYSDPFGLDTTLNS